MREIDLSDGLLPRHRSVLDAISQIRNRYGIDRWVLVDGLMVLILGREHGVRAPRAEGTKDADLLLDIVAHPALLRELSNFLLNEYAYRLADVPDGANFARCSFVTYSAAIDLLCPDDTPEDRLTIPELGVTSIAIPGGRRALETGRSVDLYFSDDHPNAEVRVPTLAGALATKAAAATDPRTASGIRHAQDVGFLLTMVSDPFDLRVELISGDTKTLVAMNGQVEDDRSAMWKFLDEKQRDLARSAYRILVS